MRNKILFWLGIVAICLFFLRVMPAFPMMQCWYVGKVVDSLSHRPVNGCNCRGPMASAGMTQIDGTFDLMTDFFYGSGTINCTCSSVGFTGAMFIAPACIPDEQANFYLGSKYVQCVDDADEDGLCPQHDNRDNIPNGPLLGLCEQDPDDCKMILKSCVKDSCTCNCLLNQEIDPCW